MKPTKMNSHPVTGGSCHVCPNCGGNKRLLCECVPCNVPVEDMTPDPSCPICHGEGDNWCAECAGSGAIQCNQDEITINEDLLREQIAAIKIPDVDIVEDDPLDPADVEKYIRKLPVDSLSDRERTLVAGNIRGFAMAVRQACKDNWPENKQGPHVMVHERYLKQLQELAFSNNAIPTEVYVVTAYQTGKPRVYATAPGCVGPHEQCVRVPVLTPGVSPRKQQPRPQSAFCACCGNDPEECRCDDE